MRLKTEIAISGLLRRAEISGAYGAVIRKGDATSGAYMVCVRHTDGLTLYTSERNMEGALIWVSKGPLDEAEASTYINRRVDFDPDLWVVEIEDGQGRSFLQDVSEDEPTPAQAAAEALFRGPSRRSPG